MYLRENFRGCLEWKAENLSMTTTCDSAVKLYDSALQQMVVHKSDSTLGGLAGTLSKILEADPNFIMGKVMAAGFLAFETNARTSTELMTKTKELMDYKQNGSSNEREKMHCEAIVEYALGNKFKASQIWEEILCLYPRDVLALKFTNFNYIFLGSSAMLRDSLARILPYWEKSDPEYGYLLNMYAFGLEETNLFAEAEKYVLDGMALAPTDSWGVHTAAHIYESTNRSEKAGDVLLKTEPIWGTENSLSCHNYWHLTNYYLEANLFEKALDIYDSYINPLFKDGAAFEINDGCQLLQKIEFEGVNVGDRWEDVYECYSSKISDHHNCYDDVFKVVSLPKSKRAREINNEKTFMESVENYIKSVVDDNSKLTREVGLATMKGIVAYNDGRFDDAVECLYPVKQQFVRLGGSNAQRDILDLLLINACIYSNSFKNRKIGRCLLHERKMLKPDSTITDRLIAKLIAVHSDE